MYTYNIYWQYLFWAEDCRPSAILFFLFSMIIRRLIRINVVRLRAGSRREDKNKRRPECARGNKSKTTGLFARDQKARAESKGDQAALEGRETARK
jgi:hypothetical protein